MRVEKTTSLRDFQLIYYHRGGAGLFSWFSPAPSHPLTEWGRLFTFRLPHSTHSRSGASRFIIAPLHPWVASVFSFQKICTYATASHATRPLHPLLTALPYPIHQSFTSKGFPRSNAFPCWTIPLCIVYSAVFTNMLARTCSHHHTNRGTTALFNLFDVYSSQNTNQSISIVYSSMSMFILL